MKLVNGSLFLILILTNCAENESSHIELIEKENQKLSIKKKDTVKAIVDPLIVTPEFWNSFSTDIEAAVYFTSKNTLDDKEEVFLKKIEEELAIDEFSFYKVCSSDSVSFLFLNDSLMFDFTEFKNLYGDGFFLIKPYEMPYSFSSSEDLELVKEKINSYFN